MSKKAKRAKIEKTGELSLDGGKNFSLSIAEALGKKAPGNASEARDDKPAQNEKRSVKQNPPEETWKGSIREAILHRESAGRGGRTVTVVDVRPPLGERAASDMAKSMRKGLGCGSHTEGGKIILQGDISDRAQAWLAKEGVKKIVRGN